MMYKAVCTWRDLEDGHLYEAGDHFPHDGREIPAERIAMLLSSENLANKPVVEKAEEAPTEERKPRRTAKKAEKNEK